MHTELGKEGEKKSMAKNQNSLPYYKTHIHIQRYNCLQLFQVFFPFIQPCKHKRTQEKFAFREGNSKIS